MAGQTWSIIIFCYNEEGSVADVIESSFNFLQRMDISDSQVIVVNDGSKDNSAVEIQKAKTRFPQLEVVTHEKNKGIGEALRSGYAAATRDNVIAIPADGQYNITEAEPYIEVPPKTIISFFRKENTVYSVSRNILSYFNKKVNLWLIGFDMKDVNWIKIYKGDELRSFPLEVKSSLVESEICAKLVARGHNIVEVNSVYHERTSGVSKGASFKIVYQAIRDILRLATVVVRYRTKLKRNG